MFKESISSSAELLFLKYVMFETRMLRLVRFPLSWFGLPQVYGLDDVSVNCAYGLDKAFISCIRYFNLTMEQFSCYYCAFRGESFTNITQHIITAHGDKILKVRSRDLDVSTGKHTTFL